MRLVRFNDFNEVLIKIGSRPECWLFFNSKKTTPCFGRHVKASSPVAFEGIESWPPSSLTAPVIIMQVNLTWTSEGSRKAGPDGFQPLGRYGPEPPDTTPIARNTMARTWNIVRYVGKISYWSFTIPVENYIKTNTIIKVIFKLNT